MRKAILLTISSVFALLAAFPPAGAQDQTELKAFQAAAGDRSVLFRGKQQARYSFPANGHPYWEQTGFQSGDIVFEGNLYRNVTVNIDALAQRILVQLQGSPVAVALSPAQVSSLSVNGRKFVGIGPGESLPEGIYEVFGEGPERIYKHIRKRLESSVNNVNGDPIGYYDENYRASVTRYFAYASSYYFRDAAGQFSPFKGKGALLRKFPNRKREVIRRELRAAGIYGSDFDAYCKAVLYFAAL